MANQPNIQLPVIPPNIVQFNTTIQGGNPVTLKALQYDNHNQVGANINHITTGNYNITLTANTGTTINKANTQLFINMQNPDRKGYLYYDSNQLKLKVTDLTNTDTDDFIANIKIEIFSQYQNFEIA